MVVGASDVLYIRFERGDKGELALLTGSQMVGRCPEGESQRFVVCKNDERTAFEVVPEMKNLLIHGQQFTAKGAISLFCGL